MELNTDQDVRTIINPIEKSPLIIPAKYGKSLSADDYKIKCLSDDIVDFWKCNGATLLKCIEEYPGFCLSLNVEAPVHQLIRKHALYFDTLCIEDQLFSQMVYYLQKEEDLSKTNYAYLRGKAISIMALEQFIKSDTNNPIAIIYPDPRRLREIVDSNSNISSGFFGQAKSNIINFFKEIIGPVKNFEDLENQLTEDIKPNTIKKLSSNSFINEMSDFKGLESLTNVFLFQTLIDEIDKGPIDFPEELSPKQVGFAILQAVGAKFNQHERITAFSKQCNVDPLLDVYSWPIYKWELDDASKRFATGIGLDEEISALRLISKSELNWLGNAQIDDLIELRHNYDMAEVRKFFGLHRNNLKRCSIEAFDKTLDNVSYELNAMLDKYGEKQKEIIKKVSRRKKITMGSFIISGSLSIASIAMPYLFLSLSALIASVGAGASILNIIDDHLSGKKTQDELRFRPIGFFWRLKNKGD